MSETNPKLYLNKLNLYPDNTLKKFNEFIQTYQLRYEAQYPDSPRVSMDSAIERWKLTNPDTKLDMNHYDNIRSEWVQKDMVTKFLGIFSAPRLFDDWQTVMPSERDHKKATRKKFTETMQNFQNHRKFNSQKLSVLVYHPRK